MLLMLLVTGATMRRWGELYAAWVLGALSVVALAWWRYWQDRQPPVA